MDAHLEDDEEHAVRVFIRFRPEIDVEAKSEPDKEFLVHFADDERSIELTLATPGKQERISRYQFDQVFAPLVTQKFVFESVGKPAVDDVVKGYNATIFAYGQTGSGKTWTMLGSPDGTPKLRGLIPRCTEYLFDSLQANAEVEQVTIKMSILEIYKEKVRDLLDPPSDGNKTSSLKLRETKRGTVKVLGLLEEYVSSPEDVNQLLGIGNKNRSWGRTHMNKISSRSHTLMTFNVTCKLVDGSIRSAKLNLADLAGSERAGKSGLTGERLAEAKKINQSLSALGNCINALTSNNVKHVPVRDSKLTYILKDSLGGNTKTAVVVTCSPHASNSGETLSSLMFAARAQHVKNTVRVNKQMSMAELQALVDRLRRQLAMSRQRIAELTKDPRAQREMDGGAHGARLPRDPNMEHSHGAQSPLDTASLYAALGKLFMGVPLTDEDRLLLRASQHDIRQRAASPTRGGEVDSLQELENLGFEVDLGSLERLIEEGNKGFAELDPDGVLGANVVGPRNRIIARHGVVHSKVVVGRQARLSSADMDGEHAAAAAAAVAAAAADRQKSLDDADEDVLEHARQALRYGGASDSEGDDSDDMERKRLREELAASRKQREDLKSEQRRRHDMWASRGLGESGDEEEVDAPSGGAESDIDGADEEKGQDNAGRSKRTERWRARKNKDLTVLTTGESESRERGEDEVWTPTSPIPPPPDYDFPVVPNAPTYPFNEEHDEHDAPPPPPSRGVPMRRFNVQMQQGSESIFMGTVNVANQDSMTLAQLRTEMMERLPDLPADFFFTRRGVPIGSRQEDSRTVSYAVADAGVIFIKLG